MLPIVAAIAGVLTLGVIQVSSALAADTDAGHARVLANLSNATAKILHVGQDEVAEATYSHESDGREYHGRYGDQLARTNEFVDVFNDAADQAREAVPALDAVLTTAASALDRLPQARELLDPYAKSSKVSLEDPAVTQALQIYRDIAYRILDVADEIHTHIADQNLANQARSVAALAGAKQAAADQRFLVRNILSTLEDTGDDIPTSRVAELAEFQGVEKQRLGEFYRSATARAKGFYATIVVGPSLDQSALIVNQLLNERAVEYSARDWDYSQAYRINKLHEVETAITEDLENSAIDLKNASQQDAIVTGAAVLLITVLSGGAAVIMAVRISRRLRSLRREALVAAEDTLPTAVAAMTDARSERQVNDAVAEAEEAAPTEQSGPNDEVGAVSQAFTVVHKQALRLAADQAMLRLDVAAMMIALARRGQSLVQRQLYMLDEFAGVERDPESISRMNQLNHLASRMRRNEENLLLLAGGDPGRRHNTATSVAKAVSEAAAEIEDSDRVVVVDAAEAPVVANVVGDVVHLLAELLENAAVFSPPSTKVRVATRHTVHEIVISIADEGIGLPPEQVDEINARLAEPSALTSSLAGTMGLLVVARLAARHNIDVQLHSTPGKGTLAVVRLPETLIAKEALPPARVPGSSFAGADRTRHGADTGRGGPLALTAEPSAPRTGTGERPGAQPMGAIVPHQRQAYQPTRSAPARPQSSYSSGWFMPATGSGDFPSQPPGSLSWRQGAGDVAYDRTRKAIAEAEAAAAAATRPMSAPPSAPPPPVAPVRTAPAPVASQENGTGALPRRSPGARLLPGSVETPSEAPSPRRGTGDGIDPDEIRSRLAGFAGGIAAASQSSHLDGHGG
ncbi:sensor histidine kinase [Stackebrandtia albiflava]